MHNAAADALGLDLVYVPLAVQPENLEAAVKGLVALGFRGVNVTLPHKEAILIYLDRIDPGAAAIGAINTLVIDPPSNEFSITNRAGKSGESNERIISGHNTDWSGFLAHMDELEIELKGRQCILLGAGGAARAMTYALANREAEVHIYARRVEQAELIKADLKNYFQKELLEARALTSLNQFRSTYKEQTLIINSTPLGMTPKINLSPWPEDLAFPDGSLVYDLNYSPSETKLMRQARERGCKSVNGLGMLLYQGATAFQLWTGQKPDLEIMAKSLGRDYTRKARSV